MNGGSNGHCRALKRPRVTFSISLEGPRGCAITTAGLSPLLVSSESPQDAEQQPGQKKGKAGRSRIHSSHNARGKGTLPTSTSRCSSHNAPSISDSPGSPIQTRLSPPPESQPREHKQWIMVPGLGPKAFPDKMGNMVGRKLFTFSLK